MAKLSSRARASLPKKVFAGPNRSFPIPDKIHAKAALALAPRAVKAGSITPAQKTTIDAKARAKLREQPVHPTQGKSGSFSY